MKQFGDRASVISGIHKLRIYNNILLQPLANDVINDPILEEYFQCDFDTKLEVDIEKIVVAAAIKNVCSKKIPFKKKIAKKQARGAVEALRAVKLAYKYETNTILARDYNKRCKNNYVVTIVTNLQRLKKRFARKAAIATITAIAAMAGASVPTIAVGTGFFVYNCLPEKIRKQIKSGIIQVIEVTKETIEVGLKELSQIGEQVAEKVKEICAEKFKIARETGHKILTKVKSLIPW